MLKIISAAIAMVSAMVFVSTAALADPLPAASYFVVIDSDTTSLITQAGSLSATVCDQGGGCVSNTGSAGQNLVYATATSSGGGAGPSATVQYYFQVNGTDGVNVPLDVLANLSTSDTTTTPEENAFAGIMMSYTGNLAQEATPNFGEFLSLGGNGFESCSGADCADGQCLRVCIYPIDSSLNLNTTVFIPTNNLVEVTLFARCAVVGNGTCTASADPMISIDPNFLADHSGYSLDFSEGISNTLGSPPSVTGVPEPAAWALMLLGFGALGGAMRARRKQAAMAS